MMNTKELLAKLNMPMNPFMREDGDVAQALRDNDELKWEAIDHIFKQNEIIEELVVALTASREANEVGHENPQRLYRVIDRALSRAKEHIDALDK